MKRGRKKGTLQTEETKEKIRMARARQPRVIMTKEQLEEHSRELSGNKFARKLSTKEIQQEAYRQYCEHIASGDPKESWVFEHPEMTLTFKTMEREIKNYPDDYPIIQKEAAERKNYEHWLSLGKKMMLGGFGNAKVQPVIYQMIMRNVHGWDKESKEDREERLKSEGEHLKLVWDALDEKYKKKPE